MGAGGYSTDVTRQVTQSRIAAGTNFGYTQDIQSGRQAAKVHDDLDPLRVNGSASPKYAGQNVHESRDNDDHPNSVPIAIFFDVTGSMHTIPRVLQTKLVDLFTLLLQKGYVTDPQVSVGAIGDTHSDRVPFQFSQFESDNRIDECLDRIFLEGNGGGNGGEDYGLALYALARKTQHDAWDKRQRKGYAFIIGDERAHELTKTAIKKAFGDDVSEVPTLRNLAAEAQERWNVKFLHINTTSAEIQGSLAFWQRLLPENVISLDNPDIVTEVVAGIAGMGEKTIDLDKFVADLESAKNKNAKLVGSTLAGTASP